MRASLPVTVAAAVLLTAATANAQAYTLNGMPVDAQTYALMSSAGLPPGAYWMGQDGTWGRVGDPQPWGNIYQAMPQPAPQPMPGPAPDGGSTWTNPGPYGATGHTGPDGSWGVQSPHAGGGVGGTSNGCVYTTFGWSNC